MDTARPGSESSDRREHQANGATTRKGSNGWWRRLPALALCGVLVANFEESAYYFLTPEIHAALPASSLEPFVSGLVKFLVRGKSIFIFSLLFGLGLSIQMSRAAERGLANLHVVTCLAN